MSIKVKTTLIIVVTLIIGIVLGAMLNRALLHNRLRRTFSLINPAGFPAAFERIVRPDRDQRKKVREILQKHSARVREIRGEFRDHMIEANETLNKELDAVLSPEQKKRLEKIMSRPWGFRRDRRPRGMRRDRPPEEVRRPLPQEL